MELRLRADNVNQEAMEVVEAAAFISAREGPASKHFIAVRRRS
jgi:hypothetical protein